jgi:hypothetical protein
MRTSQRLTVRDDRFGVLRSVHSRAVLGDVVEEFDQASDLALPVYNPRPTARTRGGQAKARQPARQCSFSLHLRRATLTQERTA